MKRGLILLQWLRNHMFSTSSGAIITLAIVVLHVNLASAAALTSASVTISDPRPSQAGATFDFLASNVTTTAIRCMRIEFDTASNGSGSKPTGMNIGSTTLGAGSTMVPTPASWGVANNDTTGVIQITFASGETPASAASRHIILNNITTGSVADDDFFMLVNTYNNTDCTTSPVDNAVVGFLFTNGQAVTMSVDGSLSFTVAGVAGNGSATVNGATITNGLTTTSTTIPFGTVTSSTNRIAAQDLTVSTNSGNGYTVYTRYTGKPASGANDINDHTGSNAAPTTFTSPGTESFGYTTEDATLTGTAGRFTASGGNKWAAFTTTNAELVYNAAAAASQTTRVGFQVGVANVTEPGSYVTSVVYTSVPVY